MLFIPNASPVAAARVSRRALIRIGGAASLGLSLGQVLGWQAAGAMAADGKTQRAVGFGRAKSVIMLYLQGGPSQLDLWDPKPDVPDNVRSPFATIDTNLAGVHFTELLPRLSRVVDKLTLIRSLSYAPKGLFNHTAAIYQMLTGYTPDNVSPSGQLEPPSPKDFPNIGSHVAKLRPPEVPMLPFVMMPRPLQESNVINKAGTAGFLGRAYDPYYLFPPGDDGDQNKMDRIQIGDLELRPEVGQARLARRARLRDLVNDSMPEIERAVEAFDLDHHYQQAVNLILSGRAREAFNLQAEPDAIRDRYGRHTFGQCCLLARRLIMAGTRFVEVIWPKSANGDVQSLDVHTGLVDRMKQFGGPMLDSGLASLLEDLDERGLLDETLVVAIGEFGRSPQRGLSTSGSVNEENGRDHWPHCFTGVIAGAGIGRGQVYGASDKTASAPTANPVHPTDLLATIYHAVGIPPDTIIHNHLNQPRELVQGKVISKLYG